MKTVHRLEVCMDLGSRIDLEAWVRKFQTDIIRVDDGGMPAFLNFKMTTAAIYSDAGPFEGDKAPEFKLTSPSGAKDADSKQDRPPRGRDKVSERPG